MIFELPIFPASSFTFDKLISLVPLFQNSITFNTIQQIPFIYMMLIFSILPLFIGIFTLLSCNVCFCCKCCSKRSRAPANCLNKSCYFIQFFFIALMLLQIIFIFIIGFALNFYGLGDDVITNTKASVDLAYSGVDDVLANLGFTPGVFSSYMNNDNQNLPKEISEFPPIIVVQNIGKDVFTELANFIGKVLDVQMTDEQKVKFDIFIGNIDNVKSLIANVGTTVSTTGKHLPSQLPAVMLPDLSEFTKYLKPFDSPDLIVFIQEMEKAVGIDITSQLPLPLSTFLSDNNKYPEILKALGMESILEYLQPDFIQQTMKPLVEELSKIKDEATPYLNILDLSFNDILLQMLSLGPCNPIGGVICNLFDLPALMKQYKLPQFIQDQAKNPTRAILIVSLLICLLICLPILIQIGVFIIRFVKKNPKSGNVLTNNMMRGCMNGLFQFIFVILSFTLVAVFSAVLSILTMNISSSYDEMMKLAKLQTTSFQFTPPTITGITYTPSTLNIDYSSIQKLKETTKLQIDIDYKKTIPKVGDLEFKQNITIQLIDLPILASETIPNYIDIFQFNDKTFDTFYKEDLIPNINKIVTPLESFNFITDNITPLIQQIQQKIGVDNNGKVITGSPLDQIQTSFNAVIAKVPSFIGDGKPISQDLMPVDSSLKFSVSEAEAQQINAFTAITTGSNLVAPSGNPNAGKLTVLYIGAAAAIAGLNSASKEQIAANFSGNTIFVDYIELTNQMQTNTTIFGIQKSLIQSDALLLQTEFDDLSSEIKTRIGTVYCTDPVDDACLRRIAGTLKAVVTLNTFDDKTTLFIDRFVNAGGLGSYLYNLQIFQNNATKVTTAQYNFAPIVDIGFSHMNNLLTVQLVDKLKQLKTISTLLKVFTDAINAILGIFASNKALVSPRLVYSLYNIVNNAQSQLRAPFNAIAVLAFLGVVICIGGGISAALARKQVIVQKGNLQTNVAVAFT
ncbi:Transmembrane domain-containing protein [Spironucleus salmonicida]|uniref:Transmembrane domain-containing protein n=1 Tax=Spironucleus salmonicida TaxID=348837 RepID=V6LZP9_9EUKA|nr:Transmembrane domain-containing protein [Spironucleus salmonicida]|eukprot:EST46324.1 Transmembrane domain-containing protein [Spironucleus salmonicida]